MKAAMIQRNGGPEVFVYGDVPDPMVDPGGVVVDIHAARVNAADWFKIGHSLFPIFGLPCSCKAHLCGTTAEVSIPPAFHASCCKYGWVHHALFFKKNYFS